MIKALFVDIGGVVLTNGWDHKSRAAAAAKFGLDLPEFERRHALIFSTYEVGKLVLREYLQFAVFYCDRTFSQQQFEEFMYEQSAPLEGMLAMLKEVKQKYGFKVVAVSNEGRELTEYRIAHCGLDEVFDFYVASGFVQLKKPDPAIYKLALDLAHVVPNEVIYIDDRALFVEVGASLGLHSLVHTDVASTKKFISALC